MKPIVARPHNLYIVLFTFAQFAAIAFLVGHCAARVGHADEPKSDTKTARARTGQYVYRKEPQRKLTLYYPDDWKPTDERPALVIFRCRIPAQREHFRKLGMVIIKPQLAGVNSGKLPSLSLEDIAKLPKPRHQVEDTKHAIRFIRANASKMGVDPNQIVATGTSGGGDLALQSYINKSFDQPQGDPSVSPRPDALVLFCPAFDGIDIWFVKTSVLLEKTKTEAPSFAPLLSRFVKNTTDEYALPLDHRADLIKLAATVGKEHDITEPEIARFQKVLELFNERDWQLLHPIEDALKMSASRILDDDPLPPTLIMFGDRDHLFEHQKAFVETARKAGKEFDLKIFKQAGHSFMLQPAFLEPSIREVETFLRRSKYLPIRPSERTKKAEVHGNRTNSANPTNTLHLVDGGAESGAPAAIDAQLQRVVDFWDQLSAAARRGISAMVEAESSENQASDF